MKISLRNIGLIEKADVDINGITVIAGKNNTGKSTVAKSLYSVFKAFYNIDDKMKKYEEYRKMGMRSASA
ncbi:MAG: AAA family ATPase, partial [Campylobacter sp.]|nr:AAA family ATPase [Campylobacter sp.]